MIDGGGSHDKCAPSGDFEILIADGAPGKPGRQVLNDEHCVGGKTDHRVLVITLVSVRSFPF